MQGKEVKLTREGFEKLEAELSHLKSHRRMEVAEKIKEAISFGDISENSEYDDAKNEQAQLEVRIQEIGTKLKNAVIIEETQAGAETVSIGSKVKVFDKDLKEEVVYKIVGSTEADAMNNIISDESPVGLALIGAKVGKKVTVMAPEGKFELKVLEIVG